MEPAQRSELPASEARREFLANTKNIAVTAPAAALLLAASSIPNAANAQATSGRVESAGGGVGAVLVFAGAAAAWHKMRER